MLIQHLPGQKSSYKKAIEDLRVQQYSDEDIFAKNLICSHSYNLNHNHFHKHYSYYHIRCPNHHRKENNYLQY